MIKAETDYFGTELSCNIGDREGCKDMLALERLLVKNNIKIGGYETEESFAEIEYTSCSLILYLGR